MLKSIPNVPQGVLALDAQGTVEGRDYENTLKPLLEKAYKDDRQLRFLYRIGPEFERLTPGGAWQDLTLGLKYVQLFERCAIVTDIEWVKNGIQMMAPLIPCPVRVFSVAAFQEACSWVAETLAPHHIDAKFVGDKTDQVLVAEISGPLDKQDFDYLADKVDPFIRKHGFLPGLVVHAKSFPGWEDVGSFFRHLHFVGEHQAKIHRVAVAVDGVLPEIMPTLAGHFVDAELKHFGSDELEQAKIWASHSPRL